MSNFTWFTLTFLFVTIIVGTFGTTAIVENTGDPCLRRCVGERLTAGQSICSRYCCGDYREQYCCNDINKKIDFGYYSETCRNGRYRAWWLAQWRMIVGMFMSLIILVCCVGGCYYCCGGEGLSSCCKKNNRLRRTPRDVQSGTVSYAVDTEMQSPSPTRLFNPSSPFAFEPPAYESLPKDPPKYSDIWQGEDNAAFVNETRNENGGSSNSRTSSGTRSEDASPPAYSEQTNRAENASTRGREEARNAGSENVRPPAYSERNDGEQPSRREDTTSGGTELQNTRRNVGQPSTRSQGNASQDTPNSPRNDCNRQTSGRSQNTNNVNISNSADTTVSVITTGNNSRLATVDVS